MVQPSLFVRGNLVVPNMPGAIPIDYIMEFIGDRLPLRPRIEPKRRPASLGDKVIIIQAATGSGKSVSIAPEIYKRFQADRMKGRNIVVTQPRVLTATEIPRDILSIPDYGRLFSYEKNIGFITGEYKRPITEPGLTFMTTEILLNLLINNPKRIHGSIACIILDEIHERSIQMDTLLLLLKKLFTKEAHWKEIRCPLLILMSATLNPKLYMDYYGIPESNYIKVSGVSYPITEHFVTNNIINIREYAVQKAIYLHEHGEADAQNDKHYVRDILIFVYGARLGNELIKDLNMYNRTAKLPIAPVFLTSELNKLGGEEYINTFSRLDTIKVSITDETGKVLRKVKPFRRIFVATNVAETGVTIETLKYCIDTGLVNQNEHNPDYGINMFLIKNVTKGMAMQRRGRVGRKAAGHWYPCYTKTTFDMLPEDQFSEMVTLDITSKLLNIICSETEASIERAEPDSNETFLIHKLYDIEPYAVSITKTIDLTEIEFLEMPSASSLMFSLEKLFHLGFIDEDNNPTMFGVYANRFQKITVENLRMIFAGYVYGANILDLITIAVFADGYRNIFKKGYTLRNVARAKLDEEVLFYSNILFADEFIDCVFLWDEYMNIIDIMNAAVSEALFPGTIKLKRAKHTGLPNVEEWCDRNNISYSALNKAVQRRDEIITSMIKAGLNPYWNGMQLERGTYNLAKLLRHDLQGGMAEICKIKQCIYDGYRFNLLKKEANPEGFEEYWRVYRTYQVAVTSGLTKSITEEHKKPHYIVAANIGIRSKRDRFKFTADSPISILDGFVTPDLTFL